MLTFLFVFILSDNATSQKIFKGTVIDTITNIGVPFATISLMKENKGTNANENGEFTIIKGKYPDDTLFISCVGYESYKIAANNLTSVITIKLRKKITKLEGVVIVGKLKGSTWLDEYSNCGTNWFTSSGTTAMIAKHFRSPFSNALLTELKFCKMRGKSIFRIRVFNLDTIFLEPLNDLVDTIIEVKSIEKHINLNLRDYNIVVPQKDFFVAIEWLRIPSNQNGMERKIEGQKIIINKFLPELAVKYSKSKIFDDSNFPETWHCDYRGKWNPVGMNMQIVMSAKLEHK